MGEEESCAAQEIRSATGGGGNLVMIIKDGEILEPGMPPDVASRSRQW